MTDNTKNRMISRAQQAAEQGSLRRTRALAAERQSNEYDGMRWIELRDIKADSRIQVRAGGLDQDTVERYATIMFENQSYAPFPPIELYRAEGEEDLWLSAGFHRVAAVEQANRWLTEAGLEPIGGVDAYVRPGGWQAAYWNAITDNLKHGKQLTTADLKNALYRLMGYDQPVPKDGDAADMARLSNRQLASVLGVSHTTIRKWLEEFQDRAAVSGNQFPDTSGKRLVKRGDQVYEQDASNIGASNQRRAGEQRETESGGNQFPPEARQRAGADGKTYDVSNIQAANQRRAEEQREKGKTEQANDRMAAKLYELQGAVLAVVEGQPPMTYREIEFAVNAHLERIANPGLLSGAITQMTRDGRLRNVGGGRYALAEPSDNRYQMEDELSGNSLHIDGPELADDWLERSAVKAPSMATAANGAPAHSDDHDPDLDAAYRASVELGQVVMRADEAIRKVLEIKGIRALYALPEDKMKQVYGDLTALHYLARDLTTYCDTQLAKLRVMARTGQPYDEGGES